MKSTNKIVRICVNSGFDILYVLVLFVIHLWIIVLHMSIQFISKPLKMI